MADKEHRDQVKLKEAKALLAHLESTFQKSCEESGVAWQMVEAEGKPDQLIEMESGRHDLLVIGKNTDFHFDFAESTSDTVQRLFKENPRPLLVCPERMRETGPIMAAYGARRAGRSSAPPTPPTCSSSMALTRSLMASARVARPRTSWRPRRRRWAQPWWHSAHPATTRCKVGCSDRPAGNCSTPVPAPCSFITSRAEEHAPAARHQKNSQVTRPNRGKRKAHDQPM
jgi:hypothetical protein